MEVQDTLTKASEALENINVGFALIGGFALAAHGVVRATQDIDLLVDGDEKDKVRAILEDVGFKVVMENNEVAHLSGAGQLDLLFANREPTKKMISRASRINDFPVPVVCVEDLIGLKIQAYKNDSRREFQDKADIQALMEINSSLDFKQIKIYADMFDEWKFIKDLSESL